MCSKILNELFALCSIMNALIMILELSNKREFLKKKNSFADVVYYT